MKLRFTVLFALITLLSFPVWAQESISINFAPQFGAPTAGTSYGVVPVEGGNWNNMNPAGMALNSQTGTGDKQSNKSGSVTTLNTNTGESVPYSAAWNCNNVYRVSGTRPTITDNAILYYGYLDDSGNAQSFTMSSPYFSYDIYYYATTDSNGFTRATINGMNYSGSADAGTIANSTASWGTPVKGSTVTLQEGVNYLRVSSEAPSISITGTSDSTNKRRGSFGALQIVNTAASLSQQNVAADFNWADSVWTNDLTNETNQAWTDGAGVRIFTAATSSSETITANMGTTPVYINRLLKGGTGNLTLNGTVYWGNPGSSIAAENLVVLHASNNADTGVSVSKFNIAPQASIAFTEGSALNFKVSGGEQNVVTGTYFKGNSATSLASIDTTGSVIATVTSTTASDGVNFLATGSAITDNNTRTFNSLTTEKDYVNNSAVTITSGMILMRGDSHWIKGGGTITSGYQNLAGKYDLYVGAVGNAIDFEINNMAIIDNPNGTKLNFIKIGNGAVALRDKASSYTGKTSVLEGELCITAGNTSSDYYVASGALLGIGSATKRGLTGHNVNITTAGIVGEGTLNIGHNNANGSLTLTNENFSHDGSTFTAVNFNGNALTLNNGAVINTKTFTSTGKNVTLNNTSQVNVNGELTIRNGSVWTLNDDSSVTTNGALTRIGQTGNGNGTLIVNGGSFTTSQKLTVGFGLPGTLTLNSGSVNANDLVVGDWVSSGTPTATVTGGELNVTNGIHVAQAKNGSLILSGGTITVGSAGIYTTGTANVTLGAATLRSFENKSWSSSLPATISDDTSITFAPVEGTTIAWNGVLSGNGGVIKEGAGTLTLGGQNTYTGTTTVNAGTLNLTGAINGTIELLNDSKLTGTGAVAYFILENEWDVELRADGVDFINVTDTAIFNTDASVLKLINNGYTPKVNDAFTIMTADSHTPTDYTNWEWLLAKSDRYLWNLNWQGNDLVLSIDNNAIPEPSTWALLILGVLGLAYFRRKK